MAHIVLQSFTKPFRWDDAKNARLKAERNISFEEILRAMEQDGLLDLYEHPNPGRYPGQRVLVVAIRGYAYVVPFVDEVDCLFLKTIVPSRRATRRYIYARQDQKTPDIGG